MVYGDEKVYRAVKALLKDLQHSNALEMLEHSLPRDIFKRLIRVLEFFKHGSFTGGKRSMQEVLTDIVTSDKIVFNDWTRAMALQLAQLHQLDISELLGHENPRALPLIMRELIEMTIQE